MPKRSIPKVTPLSPTQRDQPKVAAASMDMRAVTSGGSDLVAIRLRLLGKERPTRHGNDPRVYALRIEQLLRFERERDFGSCRDQDEIGQPVRVGDNVGALFDRRATRAEERYFLPA